MTKVKCNGVCGNCGFQAKTASKRPYHGAIVICSKCFHLVRVEFEGDSYIGRELEKADLVEILKNDPELGGAIAARRKVKLGLNWRVTWNDRFALAFMDGRLAVCILRSHSDRNKRQAKLKELTPKQKRIARWLLGETANV